jgi:glycosyltransferase involved in cell wall biosynthesis
MASESFKEITLIITHFNRSDSLARLLRRIKSIGVEVGETIVSDGGSQPEHLNEVKELQREFGFTLLTTEVNLGLGNSINVGQDAAKTPYLLYIQEDFVPTPKFRDALKDGLDLIQNEQQWDIVRFYSFPWVKFPYLTPYKNGFSEMKFSLNPLYSNHVKFYVYSDHPHLKRRSFANKFGRYVETLNGDITENAMCRSFLKNGGRGLYYGDYKSLFEHINSAEEPGQVRAHKEKTKKLSDIKPLYWAYLKFKTLMESASYMLDKSRN